MQKKIKASIYIYILFLVNLSLIIGIVVYNNIFILNNNINFGHTIIDNFTKLKIKGNIGYSLVKKFNSNGSGFLDNISCPKNLVMSGTTFSGTNISTQIKYLTGNIFCVGDYNSKKIKIFFSKDFTTFQKAFFDSKVVNILKNGTKYIGEKNFGDGDSTLISFDSSLIGGDFLDDNFDSDNYKITSTGSFYYPNNYGDDDVLPRKIFIGKVFSKQKYKNIFWNNYKTNNFIDKNLNNYDNLNLRGSQVEKAYLFLDIFKNLDDFYDLQIIEFDREFYTKNSLLKPIKISNGFDKNKKNGYIQNNSGILSLSKNKTGNEYIFDFKNKDYGIFLSNNSLNNFTYKLFGETEFGTGIYLNPIDDSGTGIIEVMANNINKGDGGSFFGETFIYTGLK